MINDLLDTLKNRFNATSLRIDLAAEIYTNNDLDNLCSYANNNDLTITIKIGGCDSASEIYLAKKYCAKSIIAPMIESSYALKKFVYACKKIYSDTELQNINLYPNIETITAYNNIDKILSIPEIQYINGIVLGRDDMAGSMNLKNINSEKMLEIAKTLSEKAKEYNIDFIVGGGIRPNAVEFLKNLSDIKHYETRMIVFDGNNISNNAIIKAIEFEIEFLKNKQIKDGYKRISKLQDEICEKSKN